MSAENARGGTREVLSPVPSVVCVDILCELLAERNQELHHAHAELERIYAAFDRACEALVYIDDKRRQAAA